MSESNKDGQRKIGIVRWYDPAKSFGFISSDGKDYFLHKTQIGNSDKTIKADQRVSFIAVPGRIGMSAHDVREHNVNINLKAH